MSTFALVDQMPAEQIELLDHLLPYRGADEDLTLPWAVYGTASFNHVNYLANEYAIAPARKKPKLVVVLTLWYFIEEFAAATTRLPRSLDESGGFLHMGRLGVELREELREELLTMVRAERSAAQLTKYASFAWPELLIREPALVRRLLKKHRDLLVLVHPVHQRYDENATDAIQVGSFKLKRENIMAAEARHAPHVTVTLGGRPIESQI